MGFLKNPFLLKKKWNLLSGFSKVGFVENYGLTELFGSTNVRLLCSLKSFKRIFCTERLLFGFAKNHELLRKLALKHNQKAIVPTKKNFGVRRKDQLLN